MEDTGIKYPISLDIDMRGQLWVGCDTGKQSEATIHKVKLNYHTTPLKIKMSAVQIII
jgi:ligand-binding sensor domain-containing protein